MSEKGAGPEACHTDGSEAAQVRAMFDRIAGVYDLMNTAMTAGLHRRWRARAVDLAHVGPGSRVLDVATGTGDLAIELARRVSPGGCVVASDFAENMLERARAKASALDGSVVNPRFEWGDALALSYADDSFDAATVGFGVRNFSDLPRGLRELARVVRPGGRVVVLEITRPQTMPLSLFYRAWFDALVPLLGRLAGALASARPGAGPVPASPARPGLRAPPGALAPPAPAGAPAGAPAPVGAPAPAAAPAAPGAEAGAANGSIAAAYSYLPDSVRRFPSPARLAAEMERAGLGEVAYLITAGGIITLHAGTVQGAAGRAS